MKGTVEADTDFRVRNDVPPAQPLPEIPAATPFAASSGLASMWSGLGSRAEVEREIDGICTAIRNFYLKAPDQVMREASAYSARLTELSVLLQRAEVVDRTYARVRTMQVDKVISEIDRQFKVASRLVEIQRQDIALAGGMV